VQLNRVLVDLQAVRRVGRGRELEIVVVAREVVWRLPGVQVEIREVVWIAAGAVVGEGRERRRGGNGQSQDGHERGCPEDPPALGPHGAEAEIRALLKSPQFLTSSR